MMMMMMMNRPIDSHLAFRRAHKSHLLQCAFITFYPCSLLNVVMHSRPYVHLYSAL